MNDFTTSDVAQHALGITRAICAALKVTQDDLCLCGSRQTLQDCCGKSGAVFTATSFEKVKRFRDSQGGQVEGIPQGLFNAFISNSSNRLKCLFPSCNKPTVSCHLIPENVLRKAFGSFCLAPRLQDGVEGMSYLETGVKDAGALGVFCGTHDHLLFDPIDDFSSPFDTKKQQFLLALKAIAFSLRRVQISLGIDFQVELFRPFFYMEKNPIPQGAHVNWTISKHFEEQYLRFKIISGLFDASVSLHDRGDFDQLQYLKITLPCSEPRFFLGLVNPLLDLIGTRVNDAQTPVSMTIAGVPKDGFLSLYFASTPSSRGHYAALFEQLKSASPSAVQEFLDNALKTGQVMPLVPLPQGYSLISHQN